MDVLDEFSWTYQVSGRLLIKKREFAVVGSEMSVPFSVSVWEWWPPEYKQTQSQSQDVNLWSSSIDLMTPLSSPDAIPISRNYLYEYRNHFLRAHWAAVDKLHADRPWQRWAVSPSGQWRPSCQSVAGQRNLQPWSQGADTHVDRLRAPFGPQQPATGLRAGGDSLSLQWNYSEELCKVYDLLQMIHFLFWLPPVYFPTVSGSCEKRLLELSPSALPQASSGGALTLSISHPLIHSGTTLLGIR